MNAITTDWSREELQAYVFIFCCNADYKETKEELALIASRVDAATYEKMHTEFERDNDYQSIQKIQYTFQKMRYNQEDVGDLFEEIKTLFLSDGKYDILERNLILGLKKMIS